MDKPYFGADLTIDSADCGRDLPSKDRSKSSALSASLFAHASVLAVALFLMRPAPPDDAPKLESIAVSIISTEAVSTTSTNVQSDATAAMVSAGAQAVESNKNAVQAEPVAAESVEPAIVSDDVVPVAPTTATSTIEVPTVMPEAVTAPATPQTPTPAAVEPVPVLAAVAADPIDSVAPQAMPSVQTARSVIPNTPPPQFATEEAKPKLAAQSPAVAKPVQKPKPAQPRQSAAGAGGRDRADAAAAAPRPASGAARVDAAGAAAVSNYPGIVQARLKRALRFPPGGRAGEVHIRFTVAADGNASGIVVADSSGSSQLDQAGLDTVRRAAPFPPIPPSAGRTSWTFTMPLTFRRL